MKGKGKELFRLQLSALALYYLLLSMTGVKDISQFELERK